MDEHALTLGLDELAVESNGTATLHNGVEAAALVSSRHPTLAVVRCSLDNKALALLLAATVAEGRESTGVTRAVLPSRSRSRLGESDVDLDVLVKVARDRVDLLAGSRARELDVKAVRLAVGALVLEARDVDRLPR